MNKVFKALADPTRRQVLALLKNGPLTAGELADHFDVSKPTMSAHFTILREADLIDSSRHGKSVVYCLKLSVLEEALAGFAELLGIQAKAAPGDHHAGPTFSNAKESDENDF
jgi:DNA-binding transcriptional ArsR family regulator